MLSSGTLRRRTAMRPAMTMLTSEGVPMDEKGRSVVTRDVAIGAGDDSLLLRI